MGRPKGSKNKAKSKQVQQVNQSGMTVSNLKMAMAKANVETVVVKRGRPKKNEVPIKAKRGRPAKVVVVAPKRGRPAGSKNKTVDESTSNVVQMNSKKGRPTLLKNLPHDEKMKAILSKGASDLFQEIINKKKTPGRPKKVDGNALFNSIRTAILKDAEV
jgi:hypothetical protein